MGSLRTKANWKHFFFSNVMYRAHQGNTIGIRYLGPQKRPCFSRTPGKKIS